MVNHYRWDFIGLSTDSKPTPATSEKVTDGSTFYCSDNSKLYVWYKNQWYEKTATGGGGGEPYVLPIASDETLGGVKVGSNLSIDSESGVLSATDTTYSNFVGTDGTAEGTAGLVPAPATTDAGKFLKADGTWDTAGGGGGPTVVQTTGTSTTDVMSQNATASMVFDDPDTDTKIHIGTNTYTSGAASIGIGKYSRATGSYSIAIGAYTVDSSSAVTRATKDASVAIGYKANAGGIGAIAIGGNSSAANQKGSVALGYGASTRVNGEVAIGTSSTDYGYNNNSNYRLLTGLYDPQSAHDAANKEYVDSAIINGGTTAPTTATVGAIGTLYSCVNSGTPEIYMCTDDTNSTYTWTKVV